MLVVADGIAGRDSLQTDRGADVAGHDLLDLLTLVGVHAEQAADALFAAFGDVVNRVAGLQRARINAEERELTDVRIGHDLEDQSRKRLLIIRLANDHLLRIIDVRAFHRRNIQRRGQVIDDRVQHRLHALVLEGRAANHREDLQRNGGLADAGTDFVLRKRLPFDEFFEELVVELGNRLDHLLAVFLGLLGQVRGDVDDIILGAQRLVAPDHRLHLDQVDNAFELIFGADGKLDRHRAALQPIDNRVDRVIEVRAHAVHLVNEADAGNVVLIGLPPYRFRLRLHAGDGVENCYCAIQHAQATLDLGGEIYVAGSIDDVDLGVAPLTRGRGGSNRDAALLLLLHPVHGGGALMNFAELVGAAGVIQNPLSRGGLTGIDMSRDADISHPLERYSAWHKS